MSKQRFQVIAYVGAFVPTEKILLTTRFEWLARKYAAYHIKRKYLNTPIKLFKPDETFEWLNSWSTQTLEEQKGDMVGDTTDRCDVVEVKEDVIRGSSPVESEIPEEQIIKEIEAKSPKIQEEPLPPDEASRKLELIRREMDKKKRAAIGKKLILP